MGALVALAWIGVHALRLPAGLVGRALEVGLPGLMGLIVYFAVIAGLRITEARLMVDLIRRKLGV